MLDSFAWFTVAARLAVIPVFIHVMYKQYRQFDNPELRGLKVLLLVLVSVILFGNGFSIITNFYRQPDGNLVEWMRRTSMLVNGLTVVAMGAILELVYKYKNN